MGTSTAVGRLVRETSTPMIAQQPSIRDRAHDIAEAARALLTGRKTAQGLSYNVWTWGGHSVIYIEIRVQYSNYAVGPTARIDATGVCLNTATKHMADAELDVAACGARLVAQAGL